MVGRSREWICGAEKGTRGVRVPVSMFGIFAAALGVPVDEFFRADANLEGYGPAQRRVLFEQITNALELPRIVDRDFGSLETCEASVRKVAELERTSSYKELGDHILWLVPRLDEACEQARGRTKESFGKCLGELDCSLRRIIDEFIESELQSARALHTKFRSRAQQRGEFR